MTHNTVVHAKTRAYSASFLLINPNTLLSLGTWLLFQVINAPATDLPQMATFQMKARSTRFINVVLWGLDRILSLVFHQLWQFKII